MAFLRAPQGRPPDTPATYANTLLTFPKRYLNIFMELGGHSHESGNPEENSGFRVKPGMTVLDDLQELYPGAVSELRWEPISAWVFIIALNKLLHLIDFASLSHLHFSF
jgi:hypothetical protein